MAPWSIRCAAFIRKSPTVTEACAANFTALPLLPMARCRWKICNGWLAKNCSKFLYHQVLLSGDSAQNVVLVCITSLLAKTSSFHWCWALWTGSQTEQWITVSSVTPGLSGREIIRVFRSMTSGPRSSGPLMCFIPVIADTHIDYQGH